LYLLAYVEMESLHLTVGLFSISAFDDLEEGLLLEAFLAAKAALSNELQECCQVCEEGRYGTASQNSNGQCLFTYLLAVPRESERTQRAVPRTAAFQARERFICSARRDRQGRVAGLFWQNNVLHAGVFSILWLASIFVPAKIIRDAMMKAIPTRWTGGGGGMKEGRGGVREGKGKKKWKERKEGKE
jgi:hypothetical protein